VAEKRSGIQKLRRALFERSEFARRWIRRASKGIPLTTPRAKWFWVLLPKQKELGRRDEPRQLPFKVRYTKNYSCRESPLASSYVFTLTLKGEGVMK